MSFLSGTRSLFYILLLRILDLLDKTQPVLDRRCHQLTGDVILPLSPVLEKDGFTVLIPPLLYYLRLQIEDSVSR